MIYLAKKRTLSIQQNRVCEWKLKSAKKKEKKRKEKRDRKNTNVEREGRGFILEM